MAKHRLAILGYGKIAEDQHIPAIRASDAFELAAVVSGHARSVSGVDKVFANIDELLTQAPEIDCVAVCSTPKDRFDTARRMIAAGKSVMLEKPPAVTIGEARALKTMAEAKGVSLFTTWHARANAAVAEAARRLKGQTVKRLAITWKEDVRKWHPGQEWVWQAGGFGVFDPGVNALSIVTAVMPAPIFVTSAKLSFPANRQSPIAAELSFGCGADGEQMSAVFDWRQTGPQTWNIEIETTDRLNILLYEGGAKLDVDGDEVEMRDSSEYVDLYARFAELLEKGGSAVDLRPLELVADAFLCGERVEVEPFEDEPPADASPAQAA